MLKFDNIHVIPMSQGIPVRFNALNNKTETAQWYRIMTVNLAVRRPWIQPHSLFER